MQLFKSIFQAPAQVMQIIRFYMALRLPNFSLVEDPAMGIFNSILILNTNFKQKHLQKKKKKTTQSMDKKQTAEGNSVFSLLSNAI